MADEEYDDTYYAPVLANNNGARTLTFQTRMLNQHLVCQLCMGYFNDACTIIEVPAHLLPRLHRQPLPGVALLPGVREESRSQPE